MSSNSYVSTVDLTLRPSMRAFKLMFWLHALPLVLLPWAMQPGPAMWLVLLLFGLSWLYLRRHPVFGFGPKALTRLVWHAEGSWTLYQGEGAGEDAELLGRSYRHPQLLVLNFRLQRGGHRYRALLGDECDAELLRRLRARLQLRHSGSD